MVLAALLRGRLRVADHARRRAGLLHERRRARPVARLLKLMRVVPAARLVPAAVVARTTALLEIDSSAGRGPA